MTVRMLALDHFFDQDLRALERHPDVSLRRVGYQRLRLPALDILGETVGTGLDRFLDPDLREQRARYRGWLHREVRRMYVEWPFDVFVLPSDVFFYVRDLPDAVHELGAPVAVVQKETTISPDTMTRHSGDLGRATPFVSDLMTVCSERHRSFWIRSGADPRRVVVTGQPRFDVYAEELVPPTSGRPRRVLFLSYELDAYEPGVGQGMGRATWSTLREQTEAVLVDLVRQGGATVTVKPHPQQSAAGRSRLEALAGESLGRGLRFADPNADSRHLIASADVVVGFQTTGLYEAVAARRVVVYAAWGEHYERHRPGLIAFDRAPAACVHHALGPEELRSLIVEADPAPSGCEPWVTEALGPIDGHATDRVVHLLQGLVDDYAATPLRRRVDRRRTVGVVLAAVHAAGIWVSAAVRALLGGPAAPRDVLRAHRRIAAQRLATIWAGVRGTR